MNRETALLEPSLRWKEGGGAVFLWFLMTLQGAAGRTGKAGSAS